MKCFFWRDINKKAQRVSIKKVLFLNFSTNQFFVATKKTTRKLAVLKTPLKKMSTCVKKIANSKKSPIL